MWDNLSRWYSGAISKFDTSTLPIHNSNSTSWPNLFLRIGAALKSVQIVPWLSSIVKFFSRYLHFRNPFQSQDIPRNVLLLVVAITALLLDKSKDLTPFQSGFIAITLFFGAVATFNGIMWEDGFPRAAVVMQALGVASIFLSFFRISSLSFLPGKDWVSWVCFTLICVPLLLCLLPDNSKEDEFDSADPPNNSV